MSARVAVVTGAASGIGLGVARRLAAEGHAVALLDRDGDGVEKAAADLAGDGFAGRGYAVDVADRTGVERVFGSVREELGPVTILVTSAGIESFDAVLDITPEKWDQILAINLTGTFTCMQLAVADMMAAGWGRIVTISSSSAQSGAPHMAHYVASKGGVIGLTKALARELAGPGHHRQHHPSDHRRHAHGQKGGGGGEGGQPRRDGEDGPDRASGDVGRHRRHLRLPVLRRRRLHHRSTDRRQRRHVHLRPEPAIVGAAVTEPHYRVVADPAPRSSRLSTFPEGLRGNASRKVTARGTLNRASWPRQWSRRSSAVARGTLAQDDEGHRDLAPPVVRTAHHGRLEHGVVLVEHTLDLRAGDVLAARHDHVLEPIDDEQIAVLVTDADVAGVEPSPGERSWRWPPGPASSP